MTRAADEYYLCIDGETRGPYSAAQLRSMWNSGAITLDTQYWSDGLDDWYSVSNLFDFIKEAQATPEPAQQDNNVESPLRSSQPR